MQCYNSFFDKNKVYLIDHNTIIGLEFGKISTESFLIKLEESIDKNGIFKRCDNNRFEFSINGEDQYYFCLNETLMDDFDKGFYTPFTKELKRLLDKKEKLDNEKELLVQANEQASNGEVIDEACMY